MTNISDDQRRHKAAIQRKWRQSRKRIDYYISQEALDIIDGLTNRFVGGD